MKIISWNVNGIRAVAQKNFFGDIEIMAPDILCIQETKAQDDQRHHHGEACELSMHGALRRESLFPD